MAPEEKSGDQQSHVWDPGMSVENYVPIYPVDVEIFHWIMERLGLLVALQEMSGDHLSQ